MDQIQRSTVSHLLNSALFTFSLFYLLSSTTLSLLFSTILSMVPQISQTLLLSGWIRRGHYSAPLISRIHIAFLLHLAVVFIAAFFLTSEAQVLVPSVVCTLTAWLCLSHAFPPPVALFSLASHQPTLLMPLRSVALPILSSNLAFLVRRHLFWIVPLAAMSYGQVISTSGTGRTETEASFAFTFIQLCVTVYHVTVCWDFCSWAVEKNYIPTTRVQGIDLNNYLPLLLSQKASDRSFLYELERPSQTPRNWNTLIQACLQCLDLPALPKSPPASFKSDNNYNNNNSTSLPNQNNFHRTAETLHQQPIGGGIKTDQRSAGGGSSRAVAWIRSQALFTLLFCRRDPNAGDFSRTLVALPILTFALVRSVEEDEHGVSQKDLPQIFSRLLQLTEELEKRTLVQTVQSAEVPWIAACMDATQHALYTIIAAYGLCVFNIELSRDDSRLLKSFIETYNVPIIDRK